MSEQPEPAYIVNNQTGTVHLASCRVGTRSAYASEWTVQTATMGDRAHVLCLPEGLPHLAALALLIDPDAANLPWWRRERLYEAAQRVYRAGWRPS